MALFKEAVERKIDDLRGRLRGEAKKLTQHCIQLPNSIGYKQAVFFMERCYGSLHAIVAACRREIMK